MKNKKIIFIITALCCMMIMSACKKERIDNSGTVNNTNITSNAGNKSGEATVIDVFSELNVSFEGENDDGKIICEYTGDNEFVKEYVNFKSNPTYGLRNGELVTVTLNCNEFKAEQLNIAFKEPQREYTVDGLWGSIVYPDGYDFSEIDDFAYSFFIENENSKYVIRYLNKFKNSENNQDETLNDDNLLLITKPDGNIDEVGTRDAAYWKILSLSCEPCAKELSIFENKDFGQENTYSLYYKISIKAEKSAFEVNNASKDTIYNVGDIKEWDFIGALQFGDVSVEKDLNTVYQLSDPFNSFILDTNSECYDNDYNIFFNNFFTFSDGCHYLYDFNSDDPKWEKK